MTLVLHGHKASLQRLCTVPSRLELDDSEALGDGLGDLLVLVLQQSQGESNVVPLALRLAAGEPGRELVGQLLGVLVLLDEAQEEPDDPAEALLLQVLLGGQQAEHVDKVVVDGIVLGAELGEEHPCQVGDAAVLILEALGHLTQLTLNLDLTGENEEGQRHQASTLDRLVLVSQTAVQEVRVFVDEVVEAHGHVTKSDDGVRADGGIGRALHDGDEQRQVGLAVLGADAHELGEAESGSSLQPLVGIRGVVGANFRHQRSELCQQRLGAEQKLSLTNVGHGLGEVVLGRAANEVQVIGLVLLACLGRRLVGGLLLLLLLLTALEVLFAEFQVHNLLDSNVADDKQKLGQTDGGVALLRLRRRGNDRLVSVLVRLHRLTLISRRWPGAWLRARLRACSRLRSSKNLLGLVADDVGAEGVRVLGNGVDGIDGLLSDTIPLLAFGRNLGDGGQLGQNSMVVWQPGELDGRFFCLSAGGVDPAKSNAGVLGQLEIGTAVRAQASPQHSLHLPNHDLGVGSREHAQHDDGTTTLRPGDLALLYAVHLPELGNDNFGNQALLHHGAEQLLQRRQLGRGGTKGQTDHVAGDEVGRIVRAERVGGLKEQTLVDIDEMALDALALVAVALGPDQTQHTADADLVLLNVVCIANLKVVHGLDDFTLVAGAKQLADGAGGLVEDVNELQGLGVVSFGESELLDGLGRGSLLPRLTNRLELLLLIVDGGVGSFAKTRGSLGRLQCVELFVNLVKTRLPVFARKLGAVHDGKWMCLDQSAKKLDGIPPDVAALVLETSAGHFGSALASLGELLLEVAQLDVDLNGSASAVGVYVEESLLQHVEEGVELRLVVLTTLVLLDQVGNHVSADLDEGAAQCVRLGLSELVSAKRKRHSYLAV
ncbi:uncharacterized protein ColSpa_10645 [Colletotrichum spaethianum]|uniref:Uncharacterized protein n=1 Tax=Colletotrichum spaethianum TaxID=700344 RepID=A0AA37PE02_9PEZI|nr:uncharacterized protein ColSpa_10645 [Colletotrichum spaethianum]GKT50464.1 hypothetical protein ColSpa_10645 [Colletotrichum spaethianum]